MVSASYSGWKKVLTKTTCNIAKKLRRHGVMDEAVGQARAFADTPAW